MGLLEKAEDFYKKKKILITTDELTNIKRVKPVSKFRSIKVGKLNYTLKDLIDKKLKPVKIQPEEINKLLNKENVDVSIDIKIFDILISNYKIFYNNLKLFVLFEDAINFFIEKVGKYLYLHEVNIIFNGEPFNDRYKDLILKIENKKELIDSFNGVLNIKKTLELDNIDDSIFMYKALKEDEDGQFIFIFKIVRNELKRNDYFFEAITIFLDSISNLFYRIYLKTLLKDYVQKHLNGAEKVSLKDRSEDKFSLFKNIKNLIESNFNVIVYKFKNFYSCIEHFNKKELELFLDSYEKFLLGNNIYHIGFNRIIEFKDQEEFKSKINEFFIETGTKVKPVILSRRIEYNGYDDFIKKILIFFN